MNYENPYKDKEKDFESAQKMNRIATHVFAPIYPVIAEQIKTKFGIINGDCIDIGSGPAALAIALAEITNLQIHAMDVSPHSCDIAGKNVEEKGLQGRVKPVIGDVEKMPFENDFADLMISRGSVFFWDDLVGAFNEIYRVLKPGGRTYIGGGFGTAELKKSIFEKMVRKNENFLEESKQRMAPGNLERIITSIKQSGIEKYDITRGDEGFWIHITKE